MADPQPTMLQITMAHLLSILGAIFSLLGLLVGYLWQLLTTRVVKAETRLDEGSKTINALKLSVQKNSTDVDHIVLSMRDHYKSSDEYRSQTDDELHELDKQIEHINTRCTEREKAGKP